MDPVRIPESRLARGAHVLVSVNELYNDALSAGVRGGAASSLPNVPRLSKHPRRDEAAKESSACSGRDACMA